MKHLSIIVLLLMLMGCKEEKKEEKKGVIGKYVYMGSHSDLHTNRNCIFTGNLIDTCVILTTHLQRICLECVNDKQYERLLNISRRNEKKKKYFDLFSEKYNMGEFEHFSRGVEDSEYRMGLYDYMKEEFKLNDYESFSRDLLDK